MHTQFNVVGFHVLLVIRLLPKTKYLERKNNALIKIINDIEIYFKSRKLICSISK